MGKFNRSIHQGESKRLLISPPRMVDLSQLDIWRDQILRNELKQDDAMQLYYQSAIHSYVANRFSEAMAEQIGREDTMCVLAEFYADAVKVVTEAIHLKGAVPTMKH